MKRLFIKISLFALFGLVFVSCESDSESPEIYDITGMLYYNTIDGGRWEINRIVSPDTVEIYVVRDYKIDLPEDPNAEAKKVRVNGFRTQSDDIPHAFIVLPESVVYVFYYLDIQTLYYIKINE